MPFGFHAIWQMYKWWPVIGWFVIWHALAIWHAPFGMPNGMNGLAQLFQNRPIGAHAGHAIWHGKTGVKWHGSPAAFAIWTPLPFGNPCHLTFCHYDVHHIILYN
jgi:hypothetical protein